MVCSRHYKEKFREKARRINATSSSAWMFWTEGTEGRLKELEKDYESTKSSFHKLSAGRFGEVLRQAAARENMIKIRVVKASPAIGGLAPRRARVRRLSIFAWTFPLSHPQLLFR